MKKILLTALIASSFGANAAVTKVGAIADPAIPDAACSGANGAGGLSNDAVFTETGTITDMDVTVALTHTWRADLQMDITYDGSTVILAADQGGSADDYVATFDDQAGVACDGTIAGPCTPQESLSAFNGSTTPGSITLNVCDDAGSDTGTLDAWSVTLQGQLGDELPVELMNLSID